MKRVLGLVILVAGLSEYIAEAKADTGKRSINFAHDRSRRQSANDRPVWTYDGDNNGQSDWKDIGYSTCGGKKQSPIKMSSRDADYEYFQGLNLTGYNTSRTNYKLTNTGRVLKLTLPDDTDDVPYFVGGELEGKYYLQEIIFHFGTNDTTGSEHTYSDYGTPNKYGPFVLEVQMNHKNDNGDIAVISNLYEINSGGNGLGSIIPSFPDVEYEGQETTIDKNFAVESMFDPPLNKFWVEYIFRYEGSLTYPPCTEGVTWFIVFGRDGKITKKQLAEFRKLKSTAENADEELPLSGNYRDLQPLNGRTYIQRNPIGNRG